MKVLFSNKFICFFLFLLVGACVKGEEPVQLKNNLIVLEDDMSARDLDELLFLEDSLKNLSFAELKAAEDLGQVNWKPVGLGPGYNSSVFWIRFRVNNPLKHSLSWYLIQNVSHVDQLDLYYPGPDGAYKLFRSGDSLPFKLRNVYNRRLMFKLNSAPGSSEVYYLRFCSRTSVNYSLAVWSVDTYSRFRSVEEPLTWIFFGFLAVLFFYNLALFLFLRSTSYLFYCCYLFSFSCMAMIMEGHADQIFWPESMSLKDVFLPISISCTAISITEFTRRFLNFSENSPTINVFLGRSSAGIGLVSILIQVFFDAEVCYRITNYFVPVIIAILVFFTVSHALRMRRPMEINYALGILVLSFAFILLALHWIGAVGSNFLTANGYQPAAIIFFVVITLALADRINFLKREVAETDNRYRHLAESSGELIFVLGSDFIFLDANRSFYERIGVSRSELLFMSFNDFMRRAEGEDNEISRLVIRKKLSKFRQDRERINLKATFRAIDGNGLLNLYIKLQYTGADRDTEILGTASLVTENEILENIVDEGSLYFTNNIFNNAETLSHKLTGNLRRYLPAEDVLEVRVGLREMLFNAIEHGNLGLNFAEKNSALNDDTYFELIAQRQNDPEFGKRRVSVEYKLDQHHVSYRITDGGQGFDHENLTRKLDRLAQEESLSHGRGILMSMTVFDQVQFNEKGNEVLLVKNF